MRLFYLVATLLVALFLIILSVAQFASTCTWTLIGSDASPVFVFLAISLIGAVMGCFFMLFLFTPKSNKEEEME